MYEEAKVLRLTSLASSLNTTVRDITPRNEIPAALGVSPKEPQTYKEQQAAIPKLKNYLKNNCLDTKCYQCHADRAPFPSWSTLDDHYDTHHLKNPHHRCDYAGCDKVYGNRQTFRKTSKDPQGWRGKSFKMYF